MAIKSVAIIGVGKMGAPIAFRIRDSGFNLIVCDRDQRVLDLFRKEEINVTDKASDCASSDVVLLLLANDVQIMDVMFGDNGLVDAIPKKDDPIICIMSTVLPETINRVKDGLTGTLAHLLDSPVSGGIVGAQEGTLSIMIGGEESTIEKVIPLFDVLSSKTFRCGQIGSAEVVKIINNMVGISNMFLTAEAIHLAEKFGVTFEELAPILDASSGRNFLTVDAVKGRKQYREWCSTDDSYDATLKILKKDLELASKLGESMDLDLEILELLRRHLSNSESDNRSRWKRIGCPE